MWAWIEIDLSVLQPRCLLRYMWRKCALYRDKVSLVNSTSIYQILTQWCSNYHLAFVVTGCVLTQIPAVNISLLGRLKNKPSPKVPARDYRGKARVFSTASARFGSFATVHEAASITPSVDSTVTPYFLSYYKQNICIRVCLATTTTLECPYWKSYWPLWTFYPPLLDVYLSTLQWSLGSSSCDPGVYFFSHKQGLWILPRLSHGIVFP